MIALACFALVFTEHLYSSGMPYSVVYALLWEPWTDLVAGKGFDGGNWQF